jgi:oligoendopeptidase F
VAFYDLSKPERDFLVNLLIQEIESDLHYGQTKKILSYFSDEDTYIRKAAYLAMGKLFYDQQHVQSTIFSVLKRSCYLKIR